MLCFPVIRPEVESRAAKGVVTHQVHPHFGELVDNVPARCYNIAWWLDVCFVHVHKSSAKTCVDMAIIGRSFAAGSLLLCSLPAAVFFVKYYM